MKLQLDFPLQGEADGCIGCGAEGERKQQPLSGSFSHQTIREEEAGSAVGPRLLPPSSQSFPASQTCSLKLVLLCRTMRAERRPGESSTTRKQSPGSESRSGWRTWRRPLRERTRVAAGRPETDETNPQLWFYSGSVLGAGKSTHLADESQLNEFHGQRLHVLI